MRKLFLSLVLLFATLVSADVVGTVESVKGSVKVKSEGSFKKRKVVSGQEINEGDLITTSRKGVLCLKLTDGSTVVIDASSSIHFIANNTLEQDGGKIFYKITSRSAKNSLKIKTPFAIIGIKGTTFVVNATDNASVALKEGVIGVKSIKAEFELYRKKVQEEFNNYVSQQQSAFEQYKNAQNKYAIAESVKEFDLNAGNRISFSGNKVNEDAWGKEDDAEFARFKKLVNSMNQ